jgi:iron complex transport system substrate-binding protein
MNATGRTLWALACLVCLVACLPPEEARSPAPAGEAVRIVSLAPHLTELTFSAGAGERLVGVVEYSDYPEAALAIPRIGDAFNVDLERLVELAPDLVLAWRSGTPAPLRDRIEALGFRVVTFETLTLEDVPERLVELGELIGDSRLARDRAANYREAMAALRNEARGQAKIRVFFQISLNPLYTVGGQHFISEIISLCGARNVFDDLDELAAAVSHEAVLERDPQLILSDRRWLEETRSSWAKYSSLGTTHASNVSGIDADLVTRPTLRLAEGARQVCTAIRAAREQAGSMSEGMQ